MEIFWQTIARYNAATWAVQIAIVAVCAILTVLLYRRPSRRVKMAMKLFMVFLNAWIAVAYYLVYGGERSHYDVLALFWGVMAAVWLYDAVSGYTTFERTYRHDRFAWLLYAMPFVYPLLSLARGMSFPAMTSPVMPCSVAIFTIGLLLSFSRRVNLFIILFLCHWALIGFSKVYFFRIPEDLLLGATTVPALYLFFKEYIGVNMRRRNKPDLRVINMLLMVMCAAVGVMLCVSLWAELARMF